MFLGPYCKDDQIDLRPLPEHAKKAGGSTSRALCGEYPHGYFIPMNRRIHYESIEYSPLGKLVFRWVRGAFGSQSAYD